MKSTLQAVFDILEGDSQIKEILGVVRVYTIVKPKSIEGFPYIVINIDIDNINKVIFQPVVKIDVYDKGNSSERTLDAAGRIMQILDRAVLNTGAEYAQSRFEASGMVPEDTDSGVWHWSADFSIRADKKEVIGG